MKPPNLTQAKRITLLDTSADLPFMKVMQGSGWIGRVYRMANRKWACDINKHRYYSDGISAENAFVEGAARFLGYPNAAALELANQETRLRNSEIRQENRKSAKIMIEKITARLPRQ